MSNQSDKLGSEEHKQLMRKTIKMLQDKLIMVISPREKYSFDLIGIPVNEKKPGLWDMSKAKGYEVQTSARKDSIEANIGKDLRWGLPMVWVASDKEVLDMITEPTGDKDEYVLV